MHITDEDKHKPTVMPYIGLRYEQHTAECADDYDDPARDGSLEMLGRVLIGAALVVTAIATVALVTL